MVATPKPRLPRTASSALRRRAERLLSEEISFVCSPEFARADEEEVLRIDEEGASQGRRRLTRDERSRIPPYIAELYDSPLLTPAQERGLFRRMNFVKCMANALRSRINPSRPSVRRLDRIEHLLRIAADDRERLVRCNLRLVVSIAKSFTDDANRMAELISEGNVALLRAVEKFDYSKGFRFSTYATYAVRRACTRGMTKRGIDRIPTATIDDTVFELPARSQDEGREEEGRLDDVHRLLNELLGKLSDREELIIRGRFRLSEGEVEPKTFSELGRELGVCKERVRQLQVRALEKLRDWAGDDALDLLEPAE